MSEVTRILSAVEQGDPSAAEQLLPLVYEELRQLAAQKLAQEKPGQTLQPTDLVHEAYLRLIGEGEEPHWNSRGHFFAAAAEAMRRILIEQARRKMAEKRGGQLQRIAFEHAEAVASAPPEELLALDDALERLKQSDPVAGNLVQLRYYAGLSVEQAAKALGVSVATGYRHWTFARAWLHGQLSRRDEEADS
jgi:RNA polymerase sigma factor (TIGR02999 family)